MNDIKLKPFDLQKAIAGEPVIFRNGEPYKFGGFNKDGKPDSKMLGWDSDGNYYTHSERGYYSHPVDRDYDLFMKPQEKELWIAVCKDTIRSNDKAHQTSFAYESEEEMKDYSDNFQIIKITIQQ